MFVVRSVFDVMLDVGLFLDDVLISSVDVVFCGWCYVVVMLCSGRFCAGFFMLFLFFRWCGVVLVLVWGGLGFFRSSHLVVVGFFRCHFLVAALL